MSIDYFYVINFGVGFARLILAFMIWLHLYKRWQLNDMQLRHVMKLLGLAMLASGISWTSSSLLSLSITPDQLDASLSLVVLIPFVARFLSGFCLWLLIFWVLARYYPQQR